MTKTIKIDHLARVEGHGGITVNLQDGLIEDVQFDIFEGARLIEGLVVGRNYQDIPQIVSRICAICSAAHSLTAIKAIEDAFAVRVSPQTEVLRDLLYRGESIESHALHIFLLAAPDYLDRPSAIALAADRAEVVKLGLRLKKLGNTIQEVIGGRAIHPVNAIVGGFGKLPTLQQLFDLRRDLQQGMEDGRAMIDFLQTLPPADFCHTPTLFAALDSGGEYGYYGGEHVKVSRGEGFPVRDYRRLTNEKPILHSHAKHSHHNGKPFMVGSLARLNLYRDKLSPSAQDAMTCLGLKTPSDNPVDNNKAQAIELFFDVEHVLGTIERLLRENLQAEKPVPIQMRAGKGFAATEAPRGTLYHSYDFDEDGKAVAADVITPTAQNLASIEHHFRCNIEQNRGADQNLLQKQLEMIARAYDPCISCSVH